MIRRILPALFAVYVLLASYGSAQANTFNLFSPAAGILKGTPTTYVTTSAAAADVTAIFSGSCSNLTYLRGDGTCATPPGTGGGTVNSVGLTAPSVFSVAGSPVTGTGTLALTFATGQTQNRVLASPDGSSGAIALRALVADDIPAIPLSTGVTGTLGVNHGGTGAVTLTGPLLGNGTSAISAAAASDIIALWSGTCSGATFLRGNGACAAVGTVTSVGLTVPSGFSVSGSPVTGSGTLGITGTLNPAGGGTGVGTISGPIKGNGTSAFSAAAAADIYGLWTGLCSATTFLRGDGSCQTPSGGAVRANPTALVGLTAVNGSSGNFISADGAPALDQGIAPTWTARHLFTKSGGTLADAAIVATSSTPTSVWNDTDEGADGKQVRAINNAGVFALSLVNDANNAATDFLRATRSGMTVSALALTSTALTWNGGNVPNYASSPTWTGTHSFTKSSGFNTLTTSSTDAAAGAGAAYYLVNDAGTAFRTLYSSSTNVTAYLTGGPTGPAGYFYTTAAEPISIGTNGTERIRITGAGAISAGANPLTLSATGFSSTASTLIASSTLPVLWMQETDGSTDNKSWYQLVNGEQLSFGIRNDANNAGASWIAVDRTGTTIDSIALSATTVSTSAALTTGGNITATATSPTIAANTSGSNAAVHSANVSGANQACTVVNVSGGSTCGMPTGNAGFSVLSSPMAFGVAGTVRATLDASGLSSGGSRVCTANGSNCPATAALKTSAGYFTVSAGTCTQLAGFGFTSCSSGSTGNATVTTSTTSTGAYPICTAAPNSAPVTSVYVGTGTPTTVAIGMVNVAGVSIDGSFWVSCFGQ